MTEILEPTTESDVSVGTPPSVEVLQAQIRDLQSQVQGQEQLVVIQRDARLAVEAQLRSVETRLRTTQENHRHDINLIGETLIEEANRRDWCGEYDQVVDGLNGSLNIQLPVRERTYSVGVTATIYIRVEARSEEDAAEQARQYANAVEHAVDRMDGVSTSNFPGTYDYSVEEEND